MISTDYDVIYKGFAIFLYFGIITLKTASFLYHVHQDISITMNIIAFLDCCKTVENDW